MGKKKCSHKDRRSLRVDDGGIFTTTAQWCRSCGALRVGKAKWHKPKHGTKGAT